MKQGRFRVPSRPFGIIITSIAIGSGVLSAASATDRLDWVKFPADSKPHVTKDLSDKLSVGVKGELSAQRSENLNLNRADDEDEDEVELEFDLGLMYDTGPVRSYLEFNLSGERLGGVETNSRDIKLEVNQAYIMLRSQDRNRALTFGRWSMSDSREWLFDTELDGIHYFKRFENVAFEVMYGREEIFHKDLLDDHDDNEPDHFYARAYANLPGKNVASVYGLYQMGQDPGDADLFWLGTSIEGSLKNDIDFWGEFAHVSGTEKNRTVSGYGFDLGFTKTFKDLGASPRLTFGFGFGSGDNGSGTDTAFRQTGVQGNEARFGGKTKTKYYGEVFNPELSNLAVVTVGLGFDVWSKSSLDLMYHYSRQVRATNRLRDSSLDQKPTGDSRHLGSELDIVFALREFKSFDLDFYGGVFLPGPAFAKGGDTAGIVGIDVTMEF